MTQDNFLRCEGCGATLAAVPRGPDGYCAMDTREVLEFSEKHRECRRGDRAYLTIHFGKH